MSDNPVIEMRAFHTTNQERRGNGKPFWRTVISVTFTRADGTERMYGCKPVDIVDGDWIDTPSLSKRQWKRLKRAYDRLLRHRAFTHCTDYRPGRFDSNNRPYWELSLTRK